MRRIIGFIILVNILLFLSVNANAYNSSTGKYSNYWGRASSQMTGIDGNEIAAGDIFFLADSSTYDVIVFQVRESSATADNITIFEPTANAGTKRWHMLQNKSASYSTPKTSGTAGTLRAYEANSTDTSTVGWMGPASISESWDYQFSSTQPSAGSIMVFGAPSSNISAQTWLTPGTGVATALAINVGSAGAFATNNGSAASMTVEASGFDGNLTTSDDTLQEIAQKLDDLVVGSVTLGGGGTPDGIIQYANADNDALAGEAAFYYNASTNTLYVDKLITASIDDPYNDFSPSTASETHWYIGTNNDSEGDDDDAFEWRKSATAGSSVEMSLSSAGNLTVTGDLVVTGNDITFGNAETISNATNGTILLTATSVAVSDAMNPDASDGAALGTTALEWSDLYLADGAVINFGNDQDVTLTHVADTGVLLNSTRQIQFGDSGTYIAQLNDGHLDLTSDTSLDLNVGSEDLLLTSSTNKITVGTGTGVTDIDLGDINLMAGNITGLVRAVVLTHASGAHDGSNNAATLTDSGESFTTNSMVGMTIYNITDGSSGLVTANNGTTITATLSGGTDNDWDAGDVWQVGPGPDQGGSIFYIGAASTIRHPATAGYSALYYATAAAAITVDVAGTMTIANATAAAIDAGDTIDSPATAGSFIVLHNASSTVCYALGKNGTWTDGGAD